MIHGHETHLDSGCCCNAMSMGCPAGGSLSLQIATWNVTIQRLVYSLSDCTGRKDQHQWLPHSAMTVDVFSMRMRMMRWLWWRRRRCCSIDNHCYRIGYCFRNWKTLPNRDYRFDTQSRSNGGVPNRLVV